MRNQKTIAIVDPSSSGRIYAEKARILGFRTIAINLQTDRPSYYKKFFADLNFDLYYQFDDFVKTIAFIKNNKTQAILAGGQSSLNHIDHLANAANLIGNPVASYKCRINKAAMKSKLAMLNVPCNKFCEVATLEEAMNWVAKNGLPIVLKPTEECGGLNVFACQQINELAHYFNEIKTIKNTHQSNHGKVLIESYINGDEYFMTILNHKNHPRKLLAIGKYEKIKRNNHINIYKNIYSQPLNTTLAAQALDYAKLINSSLEVEYGINDIEFKYTDEGPLIIEMNNRLPGANVPKLIELCTGYDVYKNNIAIFSGQYHDHDQQALEYKKHFCICCIINPTAGIIAGYQNLNKIKSLPTFYECNLPAVGTFGEQTVDFNTALGSIVLLHADKSQLEKDAQIVHELLIPQVK